MTGRPYAGHEVVDAVVVGTGAGGAPLLASLARAGLSVVALEAGRWWNPARDFARDEAAQDFLFWNDERLSAGQDPVPFGRNNSGTGVGGSLLHYTAYVPRVRPADLRLRSEFGVGEDWPLGIDDLAPYYDEVEDFIGVSGPASWPWEPGRRPYPLPPLPLNGAAELMRRGVLVSPAHHFAMSEGEIPSALRVGLGAVDAREELAEALAKIATVLGSRRLAFGAIA